MRYSDTHLIVHSEDTAPNFLKAHYNTLGANDKPDFLFFVRSNPGQIGDLQLFCITKNGEEETYDIYANKHITDTQQVIAKLQLHFNLNKTATDIIKAHQIVHHSLQRIDSPVNTSFSGSFSSCASLRGSFSKKPAAETEAETTKMGVYCS